MLVEVLLLLLLLQVQLLEPPPTTPRTTTTTTMMSTMSKRKCVDDGDETGVLRIVCHREAKYCECVCGYSINGEQQHTCYLKDQVKTVISSPCDKSCQTCADSLESKRKLKLFTDQWVIDEDDYTRCAECMVKSVDSLPKECACGWYTDEEGKNRCKDCHYDGYSTDGDFCGKCECSWLYDSENRMICSACDKEIVCAEEEAGSGCEHWYQGTTKPLVCRKCHTETTDSCEVCGNDTRHSYRGGSARKLW